MPSIGQRPLRIKSVPLRKILVFLFPLIIIIIIQEKRGSISNKRLLYTVGNIPILDSWCDALFPAFHCTERVIELLDRSILKKGEKSVRIFPISKLSSTIV